MKIFSMLLFLLSVLSLLSQPSDSTTILVDGFSEWKDPNVYIGDSISEHLKTHHFLISFFLCCFFLSVFVLQIDIITLCFYFLGFSQFSITSIATSCTFSRTKEPSASATSLKLRFSPSPIPPPTRYLFSLSLSIVITIMYKIPSFYTCILGCYKKCLKILCS